MTNLYLFFFWGSLVLLFYIYAGYPITVWAAARRGRPVAREEGHLPPVSIVIAAYNEASAIAATLRNKVALDYPADRVEVLVVSDESTDGTDELVAEFARHSPIPVKLIRQTPRKGKTAGLNLLVPQTKGEILIFSDANSIYAPEAVRKLVRNFADPGVGYVTGKMVYVNPDGSMIGDGCGAYMRYENWLREQETRIGSIVGVDGGVDAMRRRLYEPLADEQLPDFVQPLKVFEKGYRVIYDPEAILEENTLTSPDSEFRMRVRVSLRAIWALYDMRQLLNPLRHGIYAIQLLSHKLLRYLAGLPQVTMLLANLPLAGQSSFYRFTVFAQLVFYFLAWLGYKQRHTESSPPFLTLPYYLCVLNYAAALAAWRFMKGEKQVIWSPRTG